MENAAAKVIVIYTHNVSRAIRVHELPRPGETVRSIGYSGGIDGAKGTDVAIALGRLGIPTAFAANARKGEWIARVHELLKGAGVDDSCVTEYEDPTYTRGAMFIDDHGNNMIVLSCGRQYIPRELICGALDRYRGAEYCVTGYELGDEGAEWVIQEAFERGIKTIVNPSPVPAEIPDCWDKVGILVLNEHEIASLLGDRTAVESDAAAESALHELQKRCGCRSIVLTLGEKGYMLLHNGSVISGDGMKVGGVIDTSGAGDGFLAALTAALVRGRDLADACAWANAYSSITIREEGTISSYPTLEEAEKVAGRLARA